MKFSRQITLSNVLLKNLVCDFKQFLRTKGCFFIGNRWQFYISEKAPVDLRFCCTGFPQFSMNFPQQIIILLYEVLQICFRCEQNIFYYRRVIQISASGEMSSSNKEASSSTASSDSGSICAMRSLNSFLVIFPLASVVAGYGSIRQGSFSDISGGIPLQDKSFSAAALPPAALPYTLPVPT